MKMGQHFSLKDSLSTTPVPLAEKELIELAV